MNKTQAISLSKARASLYRFLGGSYIMEVDEAQLEALKNMSFPEVTGESDAELDFMEGYELIKNYIAGMKVEDLEDLAADYAKIFLAAGDATGRAAFPYESVYVDKKHQIGGSTQVQMKALYLKRGFEPNPNVYRTMEDNIGLMLEYMAIICDEVTASIEAGDMTKFEELLKEQKTFLKKHVANWVYSFTSDVVKFADRDYYKGIAKITNGFIKSETIFLKEGGKAWDIE